MATYRRHKEAIRIALYSYIAGIHYLIEEVEKLQSDIDAPEKTKERQEFLREYYQSCLGSKQTFDQFIDILEEEGMYPFGNEWPRDAMFELSDKLIAPSFSCGETPIYRFRFKKGFKDILSELAAQMESSMKASQMLDHWMVSIINTSFYSGIALTARMSEGSKIFYSAVDEVEVENEPWSHYEQITSLLDKQLSRETKRKTGLVNFQDYDS